MTPEFWRAPNGREFRVISSTPAKPVAAKRKAHRAISKPLDGEPVDCGTLTLSMAPPSVNTLFHNRNKGRGKTRAYRNWRAFADRELRDQPPWHVPGKVKITIRSAGDSDVDNRNKATLDCLVAAGRIEGDSPKHVIDCHAIHDATVQGTRIEIERARSGAEDARHFRSQKSASTDPDYLERMASAAEARSA